MDHLHPPQRSRQRWITPHKDGRDTQMHGRFTAAEKSMVERAMAQASFADWCVRQARAQLSARLSREAPWPE